MDANGCLGKPTFFSGCLAFHAMIFHGEQVWFPLGVHSWTHIWVLLPVGIQELPFLLRSEQNRLTFRTQCWNKPIHSETKKHICMIHSAKKHAWFLLSFSFWNKYHDSPHGIDSKNEVKTRLKLMESACEPWMFIPKKNVSFGLQVYHGTIINVGGWCWSCWMIVQLFSANKSLLGSIPIKSHMFAG